MPFLKFLRSDSRILAFGLLTAFFSSFGQTFYVGAYNDPLREAFGLTSGEIGIVYSLGTLASAIVLMWSGRWIDHMPLARYTTFVCAALIGACVLISVIPTTSVIWLGLAFFALRQSGQGLMGHVSVTSIARHFTARRGRALSVTVLGFPLGQAILPALSVVLTRAYGWRMSWAIVAGVLTVVSIPLLRWLLRDHEKHRPASIPAHASTFTLLATSEELSEDSIETSPTTLAETEAQPQPQSLREWTRADVIRDPRFWLLIPAMTAPGFLVTGVFFHQGFLTAGKGWDLAVWTSFFIVFSGVQIALSLMSGPLIDRFTSRVIVPFFLAPLALGLVLLATADGLWLAPAFLALAGVTAGISMTIGGALWAEIYGVAHLGAIRSVVGSITIFGTSVSPAGMGLLIDAGWTIEALSWLAAGYVAFATFLVLLGLRLRH